MQKLVPLLLKAAGLGLILLGFVGAYYGPLEIYCFYFFSPGGRFAYEGFGVGSLWFGGLVVQNLGYYAVAAVCLPLGIGHLGLRRWGLKLTRLALWFWLGAGLLLAGHAALLVPAVLQLDASREVLLGQMAAVGLAGLVGLVALPAAGLWLYNSGRVRAAFGQNGPRNTWIERTPLPVLALLLLELITIVVLHVAIFFQGLFPLLGPLLVGRPAMYWLAGCVVALGVLIYGTARRERWAWWGSLGFFSVLALSSLLSFAGRRLLDVALLLNPPAFELEVLAKMVVLHDLPLVGLVAIPLLAAGGLVIATRRHFWPGAT